MRRALSLAFALLLCAAAPSAAASRRDPDRLGWIVPDFAKLQTGGYSGLVTVGLGYAAFNDALNLTVDYGYVPPAQAGRDVHSVTTTLSVRPLDLRAGDFRVVPLYFGAGVLFTFGEGYFVRVPERYRKYDELYYFPTGARWLAHVGVEIDYVPRGGAIERHGFYVETRALDTHLCSYVENPRTMSLHQALSTALGYRVAF